MKLYTAKVRLNGDRDHEVIKYNLTAPEMKLLEHIHVSAKGHPTLVDVVHTGNVTRSDAKERARLANEYTKGELVEDRGEKLIQQLFGVGGVPLPQEYEPPVPTVVEDFEAEDEAEEVITPVEAPVRSRPRRREAADVMG